MALLLAPRIAQAGLSPPTHDEPTALRFSDDYHRWQVRGALDALSKSGIRKTREIAARLLTELPEDKRVLLLQPEFAERLQALVLILVDLSIHGDGAGRSAANDLLHQLGERAHTAVPKLLALLSGSSVAARAAVIAAFAALGENGSSAAGMLRDIVRDASDEPLRDAALAALKGIGAAALPQLIELLDDPVARIRRSACEYLAQLGQQASRAAAKVTERLHDRDPDVRRAALFALLELEPIPRESLFEMADLLRDPELREQASLSLGHLVGHAKVLLSRLIPLLDEREESTRVAAIRTLGHFPGEAEATIPRLRLVVDHSYGRSRQAAIEALGDLGIVTPGLRALARHPDPETRRRALAALMSSEGLQKLEVLALLELLQAPLASDIRERVLYELANRGVAARPALPVLLEEAGKSWPTVVTLCRLAEHFPAILPAMAASVVNASLFSRARDWPSETHDGTSEFVTAQLLGLSKTSDVMLPIGIRMLHSVPPSTGAVGLIIEALRTTPRYKRGRLFAVLRRLIDINLPTCAVATRSSIRRETCSDAGRGPSSGRW